MKINLSSTLIVLACLAYFTQTMILNPDQLKALKLARPFLNSSSLEDKIEKKSFHRNQPRNLSLVESSVSPIETAKEAIIGEAIDVRRFIVFNFRIIIILIKILKTEIVS